MRISQLLRRKGPGVTTVEGSASIRSALQLLAERGIGALVVSSDGHRVEGIVSERDVARGLHERGSDLLDQPVSSVMSPDWPRSLEMSKARSSSVPTTMGSS